jgi:hypothetical protein
MIESERVAGLWECGQPEGLSKSCSRTGGISTDGLRAWMMRAYALGLGGGTQVLTLGIGEIASAAC